MALPWRLSASQLTLAAPQGLGAGSVLGSYCWEGWSAVSPIRLALRIGSVAFPPLDRSCRSPASSVPAGWLHAGVLPETGVIVEVGSVVAVIPTKNAMSANLTHWMPILVLRVWNIAEGAVRLVAARAAVAASLPVALSGLGSDLGFSIQYCYHRFVLLLACGRAFVVFSSVTPIVALCDVRRQMVEFGTGAIFLYCGADVMRCWLGALGYGGSCPF